MTPLPSDELAALAARAAEAAVAAGAVALAWFRPGERTRARIENKLGGSPVTEADFAADRELRAALAGSRDGGRTMGYISEETFVVGDSLAPAAGGPFWLVDPIDGTRAYLTGDPQWAVSVALIAGGRPVVGVLHAPALGRTLVAVAGQCALLDGAALRGGRIDRAPVPGEPPHGEPRPTPAKAVGPLRIAGPRPLAEQVAARFPGAAIAHKIPSLALRLAALATGEIDLALVSAGSHCWDIAAGDLVLAETGARLVDEDGAPLLYGDPPLLRGRLVAARAGMVGEALAALPAASELAA